MTDLKLQEETAFLEEFTAIKPPKSKLYDAFLVSSLFYILSVLIDNGIDIRTLSTKPFDWELAVAVLALPSLGIAFHLSSQKIGWIINAIYYFFITIVASYSQLSFMIGQNNSLVGTTNWPALVPLFFALTSTVFLLSKPIRKYFRVTTLLLILILVISVCLSILMIVAVIEK